MDASGMLTGRGIVPVVVLEDAGLFFVVRESVVKHPIEAG